MCKSKIFFFLFVEKMGTRNKQRCFKVNIPTHTGEHTHCNAPTPAYIT